MREDLTLWLYLNVGAFGGLWLSTIRKRARARARRNHQTNHH